MNEILPLIEVLEKTQEVIKANVINSPQYCRFVLWQQYVGTNIIQDLPNFVKTTKIPYQIF